MERAFANFTPMGYLKFRGSQLFDGYRIIDREQVLILTEEGLVDDIMPLSDAGDDVQVHEGILTPGFINCHCHLELSHMKGRIEEQTGLPDFVYRVVTERHSPDETILAAIESAESEMLSNGIVAVGNRSSNARGGRSRF